jgi:hypothetical protein
MIGTIFIFLLVWITAFFWHEIMHCLEAYRQGAETCFIVPNFRGLSMHMSYYGDIWDKYLISLAGGLYSSPLCFLCAILSGGIWQFSFLCLGWVQLCFGIFEYLYSWRLSTRMYRWSRYVLYAGVVLLNVGMWWWIK